MKQLFAYYSQTGIRNHVGDVIHLSSDSKALNNNSSSGIIIRYVKSLNRFMNTYLILMCLFMY